MEGGLTRYNQSGPMAGKPKSKDRNGDLSVAIDHVLPANSLLGLHPEFEPASGIERTKPCLKRLYHTVSIPLKPPNTSNMPRQDIEFQTHDNVTLRGWLYTPASVSDDQKLPVIIMSAGWESLKEMSLDQTAEAFVAKLPIAALVYDHRSWGSSDTAPGQPKHEIIPSVQMSDMQDAITYAQGLSNIDASKIALWGSSYSGGHVLQVTAIDKRVKAVISQAPMVSGWETLLRLIRPDLVPGINAMFAGDRLSRAAGNAAATIPVSDANPLVPSSLPSAEAFAFFTEWGSKLEGKWKNEVTVRSLEASRSYDPSLFIERIAPVPLLMVVAREDVTTPVDISLAAYQKAREPKQLVLLPSGHFEVYSGSNFALSSSKQIEFLQANFDILSEIVQDIHPARSAYMLSETCEFFDV
ncbi:hypothetical protein SBOR_5604 [Sclerotinia borealis F-4128]|uniref:Xaa-Pro dipeptidyl-peptidase-like domain-containing protein n=1 Tax=Sclerotinia borealis (strain F-4128) TaxID=1432307 RepID=W9CDT4_SCLBF|nr:hypothetical protein SBOR_5604 [Sclerotinia borealis F-4128]